MFLGQKSNAAFAAVNMLQRIEHTWDLDYARKVYPFLQETARFWESYLKLEGGRYVITRDASGEVGDGGSENCAGVPATVNEMLLQAHQGKIRVFPVWPRERPASFGRLRAPGAFLISGEIREGEIRPVEIESERGRTCRLVNPWPGRPVVLKTAGGGEQRLSGDLLEWPTRAGERYTLEPR